MLRSRLVLGIAAAAVLIAGIVVAGTALASYHKTPGGVVAVVRNGGPLDDARIRQVIQPASSRTYTGFYSSVHFYPAQQRFYTITSQADRGDRAGVDVETDPTSDGVDVGIEGTIYFTLDTDDATLRSFDDKYGTRTYQEQDGKYLHAYDGDAGWSVFLDQIVRPVISNDLREQIGDFRCAQLQASCALVQNSGNSAAALSQAGQNNTNIAEIQNAINRSLQQDLASTLGGPFFTGVRFNLAKITLPTQIQNAIEQAQSAFAGVTEAQAQVQQAKAQAQANVLREQGYAQCPACAQIDELKAIPSTVTVYAPGATTAVPLTATR